MMQNVAVSVINLDRRPDRMEYMAAALDRLGVPYKRVSAVDAKDPANDWLTEGAPARITNIPMTLGEHAVHASHCGVWKDAAQSGLDAVIVLEDDAVLSPDFARIFESGWIPADADIIKLEAYLGEIELGPVAEHTLSGRSLRRLHSVHLGAAGYLVTSSGIEKLGRLMRPDIIEDPLDWALFDRRSPIFKALTIYQVNPALVAQTRFLQTPDTERLSASDLATERNSEIRQKGNGGNAHTISRHLRRAVNRLRSRLRGRRRITVRFR